MHVVVLGIWFRGSLKGSPSEGGQGWTTRGSPLAEGQGSPSAGHSPGDGGAIPQEALDLFQATLLMLEVGGQSMEDPGVPLAVVS